MRKGTILIPSGIEGACDNKHLFVVLNDPYGDEGLVLLASFSTYKPTVYFCDPTCIVQPNETAHPFIRTTSFIRYQKLRIEPVARVQVGLSTGLFEQREEIEEDIFQRIQQGVFSSDFSSKKAKRLLKRAS